MQYIVTVENNRHFDVTDERQQPIGRLDYAAWLPNKAEITTADNNIYSITPARWNTSVNMTKNDMPYAALKANWRNGVVISFENGGTLTFKKKSPWSTTYIVVDESDNEIGSIQSDFKWKALSFHYDIQVNTIMPGNDLSMLLPLVMIYCTKYMRMRHAAAH